MHSVSSNGVYNALNAVINESADSWFVGSSFCILNYTCHTSNGRLHNLDCIFTLKENIYYIENYSLFNIPQAYTPINAIVEGTFFLTDSTVQSGRSFIENSTVKVWTMSKSSPINAYCFVHLTWIA